MAYAIDINVDIKTDIKTDKHVLLILENINILFYFASINIYVIASKYFS